MLEGHEEFFADYDSKKVGEIVGYAIDYKDDYEEFEALCDAIVAKEKAGKNRPGVIQPLVNWNS